MLVVLMTHGDRRKSVSRSVFGGLSEQGRAEVKSAANRFWELRKRHARELDGDKFAIEKVVSSPMARCVETAVLFAKELNEFTNSPKAQGSPHVSELHLRQELKEKQYPERLARQDLAAVIDGESVGAMLVCTHGDLAGALPSTVELAPDSQDGGWFELRPVVACVEVEPATGFENAQVLCCEGYRAGSWENLLS
jgi:phosphohistidine phosphatase SixA